MTGTKQKGRSVAHPMSNARTKPRTKARKRPTSTLAVVPMVAWQRPEHFDVKHPGQVRQLRRVLARSAKLKRPHSIQVHGPSCPFGIIVWPMLVDVDAIEPFIEAVNERDTNCKCTPTIMYTGAVA